ncbi:unnamed protein product [Owenia fusiformis]|uniref:Solute carrier family 25 member 32 n=1 Tax=Owenia fusiformis TaxID=6347 RepID=A0A8J1TQ00_OWEFU|nr:unnamed protein product [Owenia fusiformis]
MSHGLKERSRLGDKKTARSLFSHVKWEHLFAGVSGGVISTLTLHPLDLVKVRFQVNEGLLAQGINTHRPQYKGIVDALRTIRKTEGIKGLYQGVVPNCWGAGTAWGFYFLFYNALKVYMQEDQKAPLGPGKHMLAATEAGLLTLVITNPIWVVKTRLCLQYDRFSIDGTKCQKSQQYSGMVDTMTKIYKFEGIKGLYKGMLPGVFGVSHGALQFMAYEQLKQKYNSYRERPQDCRFNSMEYIMFAALSKVFAASATYPYQVIRSRLQDQHRQYNGIADVIRQTWRFEGFKGFYKGLGTSILRVTPGCCITFVVYESIIDYLLHQKA